MARGSPSKKVFTKKNRPFKKSFKKPHNNNRHLREQTYLKKEKLRQHDEPASNDNKTDTDVDVDDVYLNPLEQLMSTFVAPSSFAKNDSVDSSSDESIHSSDCNVSGIDSDLDNKSEETQKHLASVAVPDCEVNDEEESEHDPFMKHWTGNLDTSLLTSLQASPMRVTTTSLQWPELGQLKVCIPDYSTVESCSLGVLDRQEFVKPSDPPQRILSTNWNSLFVKPQISKNVGVTNYRQISNYTSDDPLTPLQRELFSVINNYQDLFYPRRTLENGEEVRFIYCLHVVNHTLKTRLKVMHHNERLKRKEKTEVPDDYRDQGLVRPKVVILTPFRDSCYRIVNLISSILFGDDNKANIVNKSRFQEEFTGSELFMPKKNRKPEDFEKLFAGNVDDSFRIGISLTKKSLKLYSDFYSSDIIIASPLGIRMLIGAEGERERDFDFLASIEILVLDQAEVFLMQNWDHVLHVMNHLHMQPRESHGTDFSRVRLWALQGWAKFYRQTLVFSQIPTPELNALCGRHCANYSGSARVSTFPDCGSISQVVVPLPHVYRRFNCTSVIDASDQRFQFFFEEVLPQFSEMTGVLVYVPSYFDYVRLRNNLKSKDYNFAQICEYSKDSKVARARDMFFHNDTRMLLYSERFHFYRRITVKGIRHLIFYQPPTFPAFYSELSNMMQEGNQNSVHQDGNQSVTVLFSKFDVLSLTGIFRESRAARITTSDKSVFMFTTGKNS